MGKHSREFEPFDNISAEDAQQFDHAEMDMFFAEVTAQVDRLFGETTKQSLMFSLPGSEFRRFIVLHKFTMPFPGQAPVELTRVIVNNHGYDTRFEDSVWEINDFIISQDNGGLVHERSFIQHDKHDPSRWVTGNDTGPIINKSKHRATVQRNDVYETKILTAPFFKKDIKSMEALLDLLRPVSEGWQDDVEVQFT